MTPDIGTSRDIQHCNANAYVAALTSDTRGVKGRRLAIAVSASCPHENSRELEAGG